LLRKDLLRPTGFICTGNLHFAMVMVVCRSSTSAIYTLQRVVAPEKEFGLRGNYFNGGISYSRWQTSTAKYISFHHWELRTEVVSRVTVTAPDTKMTL
jgi:hypothetical protein